MAIVDRCLMGVAALVFIPMAAGAAAPSKEPGLKPPRPVTFSAERPTTDTAPILTGGGGASAEQTVLLFYPRDGKENPGGSAPNWHFYWINGNVVSGLSAFAYKPERSFAAYFPGSDTFEIYDLAPTQNDGPTTVRHKTTNATQSIGSNGKGLHCCAETIIHEKEHQALAKRLAAGGVDTDGDGLTDADELGVYAAYGFSTIMPDTYNLAGTIDASYASYGDEEFVARMKEKSPGATNAAEDWSDTNGANWGGGAAKMPAEATALTSLSLAALLEQVNSVDAGSALAAIEALATRGDSAAIPALRARVAVETGTGGVDGRAAVAVAAVRAISTIGKADSPSSPAAVTALLQTVNERIAAGPRCGCERCAGEGLYPWHDGAYLRITLAGLEGLAPWAGDKEVSGLLLKISQADEQVKSGPLRQAAYRLYLEGRYGRIEMEPRVDNLLWLLAGTLEPGRPRNILQGNVGRPSATAIRHDALLDIFRSMGPAEAAYLRSRQAAPVGDELHARAVAEALDAVGQ